MYIKYIARLDKKRGIRFPIAVTRYALEAGRQPRPLRYFVLPNGMAFNVLVCITVDVLQCPLISNSGEQPGWAEREALICTVFIEHIIIVVNHQSYNQGG